jgi:hypothetical protein
VPRLLKLAAAFAALVCVLAIFIAPMIDMPETVLREHHRVSSHTASGHVVDAFNAVASSLRMDAKPAIDGLSTAASLRVSGAVSSATPLVLRC